MEKVLVLNSDYTPLNVTTMRRGFVLVDKGKAEVLKKDENPIITTIGNFHDINTSIQSSSSNKFIVSDWHPIGSQKSFLLRGVQSVHIFPLIPVSSLKIWFF